MSTTSLPTSLLQRSCRVAVIGFAIASMVPSVRADITLIANPPGYGAAPVVITADPEVNTPAVRGITATRSVSRSRTRSQSRTVTRLRTATRSVTRVRSVSRTPSRMRFLITDALAAKLVELSRE